MNRVAGLSRQMRMPSWYFTNYLVTRSWPMAKASGTTLVNEIARLSVNARRLYGLKA